MARPPHVPSEATRAVVKAGCAFGHTIEEIARYLKVGRHCLFKYYKEEIRVGSFEANLKVERTGYQMATSGDCPSLTIFWLKCRCGFKEVDRLELSGPGGSTLAATRFVLSFADGGPGDITPRRLGQADPEPVLLTVNADD